MFSTVNNFSSGHALQLYFYGPVHARHSLLHSLHSLVITSWYRFPKQAVIQVFLYKINPELQEVHSSYSSPKQVPQVISHLIHNPLYP